MLKYAKKDGRPKTPPTTALLNPKVNDPKAATKTMTKLNTLPVLEAIIPVFASSELHEIVRGAVLVYGS